MSCETTIDQMRFYLEENQPLDPCEMLQMIDLAISKVLYGISTGEAVTYLEIRNRRVQYSNTNDTLEELRKSRIQWATACAQATPQRSQRNIGTFKRVN